MNFISCSAKQKNNFFLFIISLLILKLHNSNWVNASLYLSGSKWKTRNKFKNGKKATNIKHGFQIIEMIFYLDSNHKIGMNHNNQSQLGYCKNVKEIHFSVECRIVRNFFFSKYCKHSAQSLQTYKKKKVKRKKYIFRCAIRINHSRAFIHCIQINVYNIVVVLCSVFCLFGSKSAVLFSY